MRPPRSRKESIEVYDSNKKAPALQKIMSTSMIEEQEGAVNEQAMELETNEVSDHAV